MTISNALRIRTDTSNALRVRGAKCEHFGREGTACRALTVDDATHEQSVVVLKGKERFLHFTSPHRCAVGTARREASVGMTRRRLRHEIRAD
jgi:hypothetical protein